MESSKITPVIDFYMKEYEALKREQVARIGFRDNLIYATLIALTAVVSIVADDFARISVLLVLPMICVTLGWTYLVNDEKISAIGRYIRIAFSDKVRELSKSKDTQVFGWEISHRSDERRVRRKVIQFFVDELIFVLSGVIAILIFWLNTPNNLLFLRWTAGAELALLLILGGQIFSYADFKSGK